MMHRRSLILSAFAALALPQSAAAYRVMTYTPSLWEEVRSRPETVILNFRASWSLTCKLKQEALAQALMANPAYGQLTFIDVDWDTFGRSRLTERLKVERRSTLLVVKEGREVARLVADPALHRVQGLLDTALTA